MACRAASADQAAALLTDAKRRLGERKHQQQAEESTWHRVVDDGEVQLTGTK
jgi:hypothetical protein